MALTLPALPDFPTAGNEGEQAAWRELCDLHLRNEALKLNELRWEQSKITTTTGLPTPLTQITVDLLIKRLDFDRTVSDEDIAWCKAIAVKVLAATTV